jgi:thiamine biosynthesis lipoprotein
LNYRFLLASLVGMTCELAGQTRHEFRELHMGVEVRIVLYVDTGRSAQRAARAAFDRIAQLEDAMSDYRSESEVRRLERHVGAWVRVSDELFTVLERALEVAEATDGAFDPTVGPLVALWRSARRSGQLPRSRPLDSARSLVGWRQVALDSAGQRVRLRQAGMRLDLGGIAKGFILQRALEALRGQGIRSALVEAGGDIALGDAPPARLGWGIAVGDTALVLANTSVATSGPQVQFVEIAGVRYSHIVDPRTGLGITSSRQATVVATDGALADALATALTILDVDGRARALARFPHVHGVVSERGW